MTNRQEFNAGTNPVNAASHLRITSATKVNDTFGVTFGLAVVGRTYILLTRDSLVSGSWRGVPGAIFSPVTTGSGQFSGAPASASARFYRVEAIPMPLQP